MPLLKHKGGSLPYTATDGTIKVLHYGPGLHKTCQECNVSANVLCITKSGKPLNKTHKVRLS